MQQQNKVILMGVDTIWINLLKSVDDVKSKVGLPHSDLDAVKF